MSNFKGYLIKVGDNVFPNRFIKFDTYKSNPNQLTDEDSYTDGNGELQRNILPHTRSKVVFSTPILHLEDKIEMQSYINRIETTIEYWNDEINDYTTGRFYIADPEISIQRIIPETNDIVYNSIELSIIEY